MSTAVGSANKSNVINEDNEALYDPYPWFTVTSFCEEIPWPEWSDAELNAEAWDEGKAFKATAASGVKTVSSLYGASVGFDDPDPPKFPPAISNCVYLWKRPQEVFPNATFTVYDPSNADFKLRIRSSVALKWDSLKHCVEIFHTLQFYALKHGFGVECETPNFVPNTQGEIWRPWHHVYSMCKAGKGQTHKPLFCPYGKYVVRLFYMGVWRRFVVDDKIPCDSEGNCMLPTTQVPGELWPIILTKAILKILCLTPAEYFSTADFSFLSVFTGWVKGTFNAMNKTREQIWRRFLIYAPQYHQPEKGVETEVKTVLYPSGKDSERNTNKEDLNEEFCFLFAVLNGKAIGGTYNFLVPIMMVRDSPLIPVPKKEGTHPWKRIRWIYWAKQKLKWMDEDLLPPYRRVQIITHYPELFELLQPDPKLEAAMYDIPIEEETLENELSLTESKVYDSELWCDFFKFYDYLIFVNICFKPSCFICNFKVTCIRQKKENPIAGKSAAKPTPSQNVFLYPNRLKPTGNEPIFLLCESLTNIFLNISLCVCPLNPVFYEGYLDKNQPKVLKIGHASLVIQKFDWRTYEQGEIIDVVKTVGNSTTGLSLNPGRHVLMFWLYSNSPYLIDINSSVNIFVQKSSKILSLMSGESQRISFYITNVSNAFIALTQKFGKPDLPLALREFYNTIKPGHDWAIGYLSKLDDFIGTFLNCILLILKDLIPNTDELKVIIWALRCLFVNLDLQCDLPPGAPPPSMYGGAGTKKPPTKKAPVVVKERTLSEILNYVWMPEEMEKIITIQKIFRGYRVRLLWKCQTPGRKEFKPYTERLKKVCDVLFSPAKRELEVGKLLRKIVMSKPDLLPTFKFYEDFSNVIEVEAFSGKIANVEPFAWVPITRFVIASHCEGPVPCSFHLSCNLEQFVIQGFNNDTGEEIFRMTNVVSPHYYHSNVKGYTIFVFGWNEANSKTVNWKLEMVKMKHFQVIHLCNILTYSVCHPYSIPTLEVFEIRNFYIPNSKSRICRCLIKVQKSSLLTFRLSTSYSDVQFVVFILLDKRFCVPDSERESPGKIIAKVNSTNGAVVIPSLVLEHVDNHWWGESYSDTYPTIYILEAYVLDNSWPLTKQEWGLVEPMRINGESWKDSTSSLHHKKGGSESRKKLTRPSKRSLNEQKSIDNPSWLLQFLNDSVLPESGEMVVIEEDKSYSESVKAMKLSWEEKDPGRRLRGRDLRMKFLHMIYVEQRKSQICAEDDNEESDRGEDSIEEPQSVLERLSRFSYLSNDISPTRYICSPRILPDMPLYDLLLKYRRPLESSVDISSFQQTESTVTQNDYSTEYDTEVSSKIVDSLIEELENDRKDYLAQCRHYRGVIENVMFEEQKLSNQLKTEAYEDRLKAIERMMR